MTLDDLPEYITAANLERIGLTLEDVPCLCPWAVERYTLDGSACWSREDLASLLGGKERGQEQ